MKKKNVFISYRRSDSAAMAGRIKDNIEKYLPNVSVFMDVDSIDGGEDFKSRIEQSIAKTNILLVLIGPQWVFNRERHNRMMDDNDFVRLEVASAIDADVKVYPILLEDSRMPSANDLPNDIQAITALNALEIRHSRFADDLKNCLIKIFEVPESALQGRRIWHYAKSVGIGIGLGAAALVLIAIINNLLFGKALDEVLGTELTIALIILVPTLLTIYFIRRKS